jgi:hypothetical protein
MRWAGHVEHMDNMINAHRILVVKLEGRRLLGRQRSRWVDNIRINL